MADGAEEQDEIIQYTVPFISEGSSGQRPDHSSSNGHHIGVAEEVAVSAEAAKKDDLRQQLRDIHEVLSQMMQAVDLDNDAVSVQALEEQLTKLRSLKPKLITLMDSSKDEPKSNRLMAVSIPRTVPTASNPGVLTFRRLYDKGGLMYLIGTNEGKEEWQNPVDRGLVFVTASSIRSGRPSQVADWYFENQMFFTYNESYAWIAIDFGSYRIRPTHYSFAHRGGREVGYFARSWELHGSKDGLNWVGIIRHVNDEQLCSSCYVGNWAIPKQTEFFKAFRVVLDPRGNSRATGALVVSCFEVYGEWYNEAA